MTKIMNFRDWNANLFKRFIIYTQNVVLFFFVRLVYVYQLQLANPGKFIDSDKMKTSLRFSHVFAQRVLKRSFLFCLMFSIHAERIELMRASGPAKHYSDKVSKRRYALGLAPNVYTHYKNAINRKVDSSLRYVFYIFSCL